MLARQKQVLEAFQRARTWLENHQSAETLPSHARLRTELAELVARAERAVVSQGAGHRLFKAATRELHAKVRALRTHLLLPIAAIARALSDRVAGLDVACRTPRRRTSVTTLAADARALRDIVGSHEALFIENGRSPDFVARLDDAIVEIEEVWLKRERWLSLHVGGTAALTVHLRRARQILEILDCHVKTAFEGDEAKLAEWGFARRVQAKPGPSRGGGDQVPVVVQETVVETPEAMVSAPPSLSLAA